jgi:hypothetical protein
MKQSAFTPSLLLPAADADAATFPTDKFFLSNQAGMPLHAQSTATLRLVSWSGTKQGSW